MSEKVQHDVASSRSSKLVQIFMQENKIKVLNWPGNSPDLNPTGNLWHILKNRLAMMSYTTTEQMIKRATQVWFHDEKVKNMYPAVVKSIP
ncbi:uncharacterized protein TNCV_2041661 [Trichonephila clavipes]|nr:uncharacterized protein TNCV_2041661 [Trichonephila clavipes]